MDIKFYLACIHTRTFHFMIVGANYFQISLTLEYYEINSFLAGFFGCVIWVGGYFGERGGGELNGC